MRRRSYFTPERAADLYVRYWRGERVVKLMAEFRCTETTVRQIGDKHGPYGGPDYEAARHVRRRIAG